MDEHVTPEFTVTLRVYEYGVFNDLAISGEIRLDASEDSSGKLFFFIVNLFLTVRSYSTKMPSLLFVGSFVVADLNRVAG